MDQRLRGPAATLRRLATRTGTAPAPTYLAFAAAYVVAAVAGRQLVAPGTSAAPVWPAAAVALLWVGAGWSRPRRRWADVAALGVLGVVVNAATGAPVRTALAFALATVVQTVVGCAVMARSTGPRWAMSSTRDLNALLLAAVLGTGASSAWLLGELAAVQQPGYSALTLEWFVRQASNIFVLCALALQLVRRQPSARTTSAPRAELVLAWLTTIGIYVVVFGMTTTLPLTFVALPVSVWVALRTSTAHTSVHVLSTAVMTVAATLLDRGVFSASGSGPTSVMLAQAYIAVVAYIALTLALDSDNRHRLVLEARAAAVREAIEAHRTATVLATVSEGITVVTSDGAVRHNPAALALLPADVEATATVGSAAPIELRTVDGDRVPLERTPLMRSLAGEHVRDVDLIVPQGHGGDGRVISVSSNPILQDGEVVGAVAAFRDVTAARRESAEVRRTRDLFSAVLDGATEQAIMTIDAAGCVTLANHGAELLFGRPVDALLGVCLLDLVRQRASDGAAPLTLQDVVPGSGEPTRAAAWEIPVPDGDALTVSVTVTTMRLDGAEAGYVVVATDVSAETAATAALQASESRFRRVFQDAPLGMAVVRVRGGSAAFSRVNGALCGILAGSSADLVGTQLRALVHPDDRAAGDELLARLREPQPGFVELRLVTLAGSTVWAACSATPLEQSDDAVLQVVDVSARRAAEEALEHQALHDPLTGLANRALLHDRIDHALAAAARDGGRIGLLYLDLDGFKAVNDSAGHSAGDKVLLQAAERLARCVRPGDTVARLGGDEFVMVCPDLASPALLAAVARRVLNAVRRPYHVEGRTFVLSGSVGVAISRPGTTGTELLGLADEALYDAKHSGKDRIVTAGGGDAAERGMASRLLPQIRSGLAQHEFVVHGQPILDLATGAVVAVETLVRWNHPTRGLLSPADFLTVAESSPLMVELGARVLRESCRLAASWLELFGGQAPVVHVNVSGRQLEVGTLTRQVADCLDRYALPASSLVIELTETRAVEMAAPLLQDIARLRALGVRLALDDVGAGYSSLGRLTQLPVDIIKIDRQFITGLGHDQTCRAVVRALLTLASTIGALVVAEGVETPQQAQILASYGCDTVQGFLYSAARPEPELREYLRGRVGVPRI